MSSYRSDILNNSNVSTNRLLQENDNLTIKYNQYKRNLLNNTSHTYNSQTPELNDLNSYLISNLIPDNDNDIKYTTLKRLYDERIKSLYNSVRIISRKFNGERESNSDDKNNLGKSHPDESSPLFLMNLLQDREDLISRLTEENGELRSNLHQMNYDEQQLKINHLERLYEDTVQKNNILQSDMTALRTQLGSIQQGHELEYKKLRDEFMLTYTKQSNELQKLKSESNNNIDEAEYYEQRYKEINQENEENKLEMDRLQKVISVLEIDLNSNDTKLKEKQTKIENLQHELTNFQSQFFEVNLKFKKFQDENKSLQSIIDHYEKERKDMLDKYSIYNEDLQKSHYEKLETQEKKSKEKNTSLKKKMMEYKSIITSLEEELKSEKTNSMNIKINYSKVYTNMQEDMKLIKSEWEKKLIQEQYQFEKILNEVENKHLMEINNLKHDHQIEIENKNSDISKLKMNSDLLKNFEKEYLRINSHEEILGKEISEVKKKFEKEFTLKEENYECEMRRRIMKLEDEKKGEYEFLTENIRKNLKNLEKSNEEYKDLNLELQSKLNYEVENNSTLSASVTSLQKTIRSLNSQLEEQESWIKNISDKNKLFEETISHLTQANKNFKSNADGLYTKLQNLENENSNLHLLIKEKEEKLTQDSNTLKQNINHMREKSEDELNKEKDQHTKSKNKLAEFKNLLDKLQSDNNYLLCKCSEYEKNLDDLSGAYNEINTKLKEEKQISESKEKKCVEMTKTIKNFNFEKSNTNELLIKILKTKLTSIRSELSSIKSYYNNEYSMIKKDYAKIIETLFTKIKTFTYQSDLTLELSIKKNKEVFDSQIKHKQEEMHHDLEVEIKKVEQKYEKHLLEQFRVSEKLEKENKNLLEVQQNNLLKCKDHSFRIQDQEQEIKNLNLQINKLKVENDLLNEGIEKLRLEKLNFQKYKIETEDTSEHHRRETLRKLQLNLSSIATCISKMKKKYTNEIIKLKSEINDLIKSSDNELSNTTKFYKSNVDLLDAQLKDERESHKKTRNEIDAKESEFNSIQRDLEKLKDIYENKIKLLNTKLNSDEEALKDMRGELKSKNEQVKETNNSMHEYKSQIKSLKTQLELKNDEVFTLKKEYEKLLTIKDKKVHDLQSIVNQSLYSYNSGLNNIKIANKLDDEVKVLMKRAKIDDNNK